MSHPSFPAPGVEQQDADTIAPHAAPAAHPSSCCPLHPCSTGEGKRRGAPSSAQAARAQAELCKELIAVWLGCDFACLPQKAGICMPGRVRRKSNSYIFILAVQLLPSRQNRCEESLDLASQRSWELLGYSSFTITHIHQWKQELHWAIHTYLGGHHLCIGATDLHPRIETCLVVGLHDITPVHLICSNPTVIGAWKGKRSHHPSKAFGSNNSTLQHNPTTPRYQPSSAQDLWELNGVALHGAWSHQPLLQEQQCEQFICATSALSMQLNKTYHASTGRWPGDKESLAWSAPQHLYDPLSTSSIQDCSNNS